MSVQIRAGSPYWWYDFTINGHRYRGSTNATSKQSAKAVEAVKRQEASAATPDQERWQVRFLTGTYLEDHGQFLSSSDDIVRGLRRLTGGLGPNTFVADLLGKDIIAYRNKRRNDGLAPASVNRELALLKACINYAHNHYRHPLPAIKWKGLFFKEPAARIRFLSSTEYDALIRACDDELRTIIIFAVSTGLRKANIEKLTWDRVNLDQGIASVTVKGDESHSVKLNSSVIAALACTLPRDRVSLVFKKPNKRKRWERARAAAGLINFRFHDLRHTFASWARLAGSDIADICEAMHHSTVAVTMRYAHLKPGSKRTSFDAVADLLTASTPQLTAQQRRKIPSSD